MQLRRGALRAYRPASSASISTTSALDGSTAQGTLRRRRNRPKARLIERSWAGSGQSPPTRHGIPIGWAIDGANRNDVAPARARTLDAVADASGCSTTSTRCTSTAATTTAWWACPSVRLSSAVRRQRWCPTRVGQPEAKASPRSKSLLGHRRWPVERTNSVCSPKLLPSSGGNTEPRSSVNVAVARLRPLVVVILVDASRLFDGRAEARSPRR